MRILLIGVGSMGLQARSSNTGKAAGTGLSTQERALSIERGEAIAQASFAALSGRLQQAVAGGGPVHAVDHCWVAAATIADAMGVRHGARVNRTSDRLHSPANAPDVHEQARLDEALQRLEDGIGSRELQAGVHLLGDSIAFYRSILIVSPPCLDCYGNAGAGLDGSAYAMIQERYPDDRATGYGEVGQFRGLWSVPWPR